MPKGNKKYVGWYFLIIVIIVYFLVALFKIDLVLSSLQFSLRIFKTIIPVFILVFVLMVIVNYIITPKQVNEYFGKFSGIRKWIIAVVGGIISSGPIYMWYPMLKELHNKGVGYGFIATFLYNRAIKLPLIPMLIIYFGLQYTITLTVVMVIFSIIQGLIFERIKFQN